MHPLRITSDGGAPSLHARLAMAAGSHSGGVSHAIVAAWDFYHLTQDKQVDLLNTALERIAGVSFFEQATFENLAAFNDRRLEEEWADICSACGIEPCTIPARLLGEDDDTTVRVH
jgi:hypothetical protein